MTLKGQKLFKQNTIIIQKLVKFRIDRRQDIKCRRTKFNINTGYVDEQVSLSHNNILRITFMVGGKLNM